MASGPAGDVARSRHRYSAVTFSFLESLPHDFFSLLVANMVNPFDFTSVRTFDLRRKIMTSLPHARAVLFAPLSGASKTLQCAMQEHLLEVAVQHFLIRLGSLLFSYRADYERIVGCAWRGFVHLEFARSFIASTWAAVRQSAAISLVKELSSTQKLSDELKWLEFEIGPNAYRFAKHNGTYWRHLLTHHRRNRQTLARLWNIVLKAFEDIAVGESTFGGLLTATQEIDNWIKRVEGVYPVYSRNGEINGEINHRLIFKADREMKLRDGA